MNLYIGLMSGTSMDGIDAALVDVDSQHLLKGITVPYDPETQSLLRKVLTTKTSSVAALCQLNALIGKAFARAAKELIKSCEIEEAKIHAIGSHGQTIAHDPGADIPFTLQLGCPHIITEETGIPVVADFRTRDLVLGGQGAPLAPFYHQVLFSLDDGVSAVVNIGGIANVSFIERGRPAIGFDTGPGNCLMDEWAQMHLDKPFDEQGIWALEGKVNQPLLSKMRQDPYILRVAPKSIGKEYFSMSWLLNLIPSDIKPEDVQATLLAFTSSTICEAIYNAKHQPTRLFVCGGGAHNQALMDSLSRNLAPIVVETTQRQGINPDYIEAMMMAWLAEKVITKTPLDLSAITGASKPTVYGTLYEVSPK